MKERTLNQTWTLCLRMWRWIAKVWQTPRYRRYGVWQLKMIWFRKNGFKYNIQADCFFCDYKEFRQPCSRTCPGALVDPDFLCTTESYSFRYEPVKFFIELLRLNRIRKAKK